MRKETKKNAVWLIEGDDLDSFEYICPKCGGPAPYNYDGEQTASRFCPSCGMRLDEPEDGQMLTKTERNSISGTLPPEIVRYVLKSGLMEWKIRILLEYRQLRARLDKLQKVLLKTNDASKDIAQHLTDTERMLMQRQESAMQMYLECLKKRAALHGFDDLLDKYEKL